LRCLEFNHPDRVPRNTWALPLAALTLGQNVVDAFYRRFPDDFGGPRVPPAAKLDQGDAYAIGNYRDEWGCVFESIQAGVIGEVKHPLVAEWADLERVKPPEPLLKIDVDAVNRACAAQDRFITAGCCPRPFERLQFLRGSENVYADLAEDSSELAELLRLIHDYYRREAEIWCKTNIDGLMFMDDWGSQRALLISPAQWRRIFKPLYKEYCAIAKAHGKKVFMHSDGHIFDIYEDLIEIGVDAINSQLFCMDIAAIGKRFKGRITFWGEIDRQHVLSSPNPQDGRDAVRLVAQHLYDPSGGVIDQFEMGAGVNIIAVAQAIHEEWERIGKTS